MNKNILIGVVVVLIGFGAWLTLGHEKKSENTITPTASVMDTSAAKESNTVTPTAVATGASGISGYAHHGPNCMKLEEYATNPRCDNEPHHANIIATDQKGAKFMVMSNTDGTFRITLAPGSYVVTAQTEQLLFPVCESKTVAVRSGMYTSVDIACQTDIVRPQQ